MTKTPSLGRNTSEQNAPCVKCQYRGLMQRLRVVIWEADPKNRRFTLVSPHAQELLGYPLEQWYQEDFWISHLHDDDRDRVLTESCIAVSQGLEHELEYRMVAAEGHTVWLREVVQLELSQGQPAKLRGVMVESTERKHTEEELRRKTASAEESSRLKSEFLANMSHEIRTPMNGIIGFAELLAMEELPQQQAEWVGVIRNCGRELLALIDDILDISRIEANQLRIEPCQFAISDILDDVVQSRAASIKEKGLSFSVEVAQDTPPHMNSDPQRLRQILSNLLTNATKFTDAGKISVRTEGAMLEREPAVRFEVSDTGIGISEEDQKIIFDVFKQVDSAASRKYEGSGLGLAICKRLVDMLGGCIWVDSASDQGSTFTFVLPLNALSGQRVTLAGDIDMDQTQHSTDEMTESDHQNEQEAASILQLKGRVLLVEDSQINQNLFSIILSRVGLDVDLAGNGQEAVDMGTSGEYDLILMDVQMPVLDGLQATRILRDKGVKSPIVALTAHAMNQDQQRCLEAGCDGFLSKPLNQGALLAVVQQYLRSEVTAG